MKIIINADDCGRTNQQNVSIERAILANKITSTSIMANMLAFEGAVSLYNNYKDHVSFGVHLNLTEGEPLLYSQKLLDIGFYKQEEGRLLFNGLPFIRKFLPKTYLYDIKKELIQQVNKIRDYGIDLSHIDSHNHIHTSNFMLFLLPSLCDELGIYKMRNIRNLLPFTPNLCVRILWTNLEKLLCPTVRFTDKFASFTDFQNWNGDLNFNTFEIMCHPGHPSYINEEVALYQYEIPKGYQLINYFQL